MTISYNSRNGQWSCDDCARRFPHRAALDQHLKDSNAHAWCSACEREFPSWSARRQHWTDSPRHHFCALCDMDFDDEDDLLTHRTDDHHHCENCDETFASQADLEEHDVDSHSYCAECDRFFASDAARLQHWSNSSSHHFCLECILHFDDDAGLRSHKTRVHHLCDVCDIVFRSLEDLRQHDVDEHFYCIPCDRYFQNANSLTMHLRSSKHQPKKYECPMRKCTASFISVSALIAHGESGGCPGGVTRRLIDQHLAARDVKGLLTDRARIGNAEQADKYPYGGGRLFATERAWNGTAYECYLCHRDFRELKDLNAHIASPKHTGGDRLYQCPPAGGCGGRFNTLSGLVRHIEDESCGVRRFNKKVERAIEDVVRTMDKLRITG